MNETVILWRGSFFYISYNKMWGKWRRDRDRETERESERESERHRERAREKDKEVVRCRERQKERERVKEKARGTERESKRERAGYHMPTYPLPLNKEITLLLLGKILFENYIQQEL